MDLTPQSATKLALKCRHSELSQATFEKLGQRSQRFCHP